MTLFKVSLPEGAHVLLLEDSDMRIAWFQKRIKNLKVVKSVQEFKAYFDTHPTVDFIFYDHDLGEGNGTGYDAACFVKERFGGMSRWGMIHSWNRAGAQRIQAIATQIPHVPFGEFEIEEV